MRAAEQGKQTVCLVEVQARFDEERNIQWARALERSGVHVVYGLSGLKTHAKLALVLRREGNRVRRYVHFGTGNYNPSTARLYTDYGLFTCREDIAEDVADLFNHLTGFARPPMYRRAWWRRRTCVTASSPRSTAPSRGTARRRPRDRDEAELAHRRADHQAIYRASQAGVQVDMIVRSIAASAPESRASAKRARDLDRRALPGTRARVRLPLGRDDADVPGSSDMMVRNLDNRVEVMTPVEDAACQRELLGALELELSDTTLAWDLYPDGRWVHRHPNDGQAPFNSQDALMRRARAL